MKIDNYRGIRIKDCSEPNTDYGIIMLHNKHTVQEFQDIIYKIKDRFVEEGNFEWQVDDILMDKELETLDWYTIPTDCYDYVEV